jgi:hypothetical protein
VNEYFAKLLADLTAPAIAIACLGALGKWYLDRILERQTTKLEGSLSQETERLKHALTTKLAVTQAKLQSLQQVSGSVYKARRACRDLHEIVFPQSDTEQLRLLKLAEKDPKALPNLANDRNIQLAAAALALEEELDGAREYMPPAHIKQLEQLLTTYFAVRSKVSEFFVPSPKSATFADELAQLFADADGLGKQTAELLVAARKTLLDAHAG